jgi:hypothetical protein
MESAPCKDCQSRNPRCHAVCESYRTWKAKRDDERESRMIESETREVQITSIERTKKKYNHRR